ncbi:ABC transporter permease [Niallia sp. FSL K6-0077]|jgi:oligopeptide transport system permease protein|uniref:ABC transporter permease n=1 Tax=Niallia sp. FSL K6-0077 TaxID=2954743 RepID=UPI0030FCC42D
MEQNNSYTFQTDDFILAPKKGEAIQLPKKEKPFWKSFMKRILSNKGTSISLFTIILIILYAFLAPIFSPYTLNGVNASETNLSPRIPFLEDIGIFNGYTDKVSPNYHYFGTDNLGRDIWTRVALGTRLSLYISAIAMIIDLGIGLIYGLVSGYIGGKVDIVMQRITEVMSTIPTMIVVTLLLVVLKPGMGSIVIAMILTGWINMSRIIRAQVLKLKEQEFVLAAKTIGVSNFTIIFKEILPNTVGQIIVTFMFSIPTAIFLEAFLAFIGLGIPAPLASLGSMINDGYKSALVFPHMIIFPVTILGLLMLSFNIMADGLRDLLDPQLKER